MLTTIPFSGFYESLHSGQIDWTLERIFEDREGRGDCAPEFLLEVIWDGTIDYPAVFEKYAKTYAESFLEEFELNGKFESMTSPREYNFETDRIFVDLDESSVKEMWQNVDKVEFTKLCREKFTSHSGFISFYSADWREWGPIADWDHNQLGTLVEAYAGEFEEFDLVEDLQANGCLDNWIYEHSNNRFTRAVNAWEYLQDRSAR